MTNNIKFLPRTCKEKEKGIKSRNCHLHCMCWVGGGGLLCNEEKSYGFKPYFNYQHCLKLLLVTKSYHTNKRVNLIIIIKNNIEAKFITLYAVYHNFNYNTVIANLFTTLTTSLLTKRLRCTPLFSKGLERRGAEHKPLASEHAFKNNVKHKVTLYKIDHAIMHLDLNPGIYTV